GIRKVSDDRSQVARKKKCNEQKSVGRFVFLFSCYWKGWIAAASNLYLLQVQTCPLYFRLIQRRGILVGKQKIPPFSRISVCIYGGLKIFNHPTI
ncbi:MAG TPA: hypothetical protein DCL77_16140, partial [Prolixibacteraceae bacterium]|nr:hypothetical protein [Prolixibacteraceae bacterium]